MTERGRCIARTDRFIDRGDKKLFETWCGELAQGWYFLDAEHAALTGAQGSALWPCRKCVSAVYKGLRGKYDELPPPLFKKPAAAEGNPNIKE